MRIIANHAHVFQESVQPHGSISALKQVMDECGISQAVAFAPFPKHFNHDEAPNTNPNRWLCSEIKDDDRLYCFGVIDMEKDNVADQVQEIYDLGLNGIKMHPAYQHFAVDDRKAYAVYEKAEQLGLPISFHTGVHNARIRQSHTLLFDEVAFNFKNLRFTLEHVGGYSFSMKQ